MRKLVLSRRAGLTRSGTLVKRYQSERFRLSFQIQRAHIIKLVATLVERERKGRNKLGASMVLHLDPLGQKALPV